MADQALFAYRVQLPDGSEAIRTGGADRAPTHGELADYAANQGERYLGHVDMSPAPPPSRAPAPSPAPEPAPRAAAVAPPAPTEAPTVASQVRQTLLPERSLGSEGLSIGGGVLGGAAGALTGPAAPVVAPLAAGAGSALGEAGQVGLERFMGWPAAEPGTVGERMTRAAIRGAAGEGAGQVLRAGGRAVVRAVGPTLQAAEEVAPVLAQDLPATVKAVPTAAEGGFRRIGLLLNKPAELAAADLAPEGQQTLLRAWWQREAPKGARGVVDAWDQLGTTPGAQQALAGEQHGAMSTLVDALRPGLEPLQNVTVGQAARATLPGLALTYAGHPYVGAGLGAATELTSAYAPRMLLSPTAGPWLATLPAVGRTVATPADYALRLTGQYGATKVLP